MTDSHDSEDNKKRKYGVRAGKVRGVYWTYEIRGDRTIPICAHASFSEAKRYERLLRKKYDKYRKDK